MEQREYFEKVFRTVPVMGIFRGMTPQTTVAFCHAAWDAGATAVEIPVQDEQAFAALDAAVRAGDERGQPVGAGTVRCTEQLEGVAAIGAQFTVAPGLEPTVVELSKKLGLPHLPGVATSTEVHRALRQGLTWLKVFPASVLGSAWVAAQLSPFPEARFVATGGIHAFNAKEFLEAGSRGVAIGSALGSSDDVAELIDEGLLPGRP